MTLLILIATHGLAVAIGLYAGRALTLKGARTWPDPPHLLEDVMHRHSFGVDNEGESPREGKARRNLRDNGRLSVALVMASLFVIAIGVQAFQENRDQEADDRREDRQVACFDRWGKEMVETVTARTDANIELEEANKRLRIAEEGRDDAIDTVLLTVIAFRDIPPRANDADFTRSLSEYEAALVRRDRVRADVDNVADDVADVRDANPYPDLHC